MLFDVVSLLHSVCCYIAPGDPNPAIPRRRRHRARVFMLYSVERATGVYGECRAAQLRIYGIGLARVRIEEFGSTSKPSPAVESDGQRDYKAARVPP